MNFRPLLLSLFLISLPQTLLLAQLSDRSLNGAYYVRQLNYGDTKSAQGVATFDGAGKYVFRGTRSAADAAGEAVTLSGDYHVSPNGLLTIKSLLEQDRIAQHDTLRGSVASGVVLAAEVDFFPSLLVAIPKAQTVSNATLAGTYRFVSLDYLDGAFRKVRNATFLATANGQGGLGNLTVTGQAANLNTPQTMQTVNGATYSLMSDGSGTLTLPTLGSADSLLLSGNKVLAVSADGNFVLGGSTNGFDMILGVKSLPGNADASTYQGLYYFGGLELAATVNSTTGAYTGGSTLAYCGSVNASIRGTALSHFYQYDDITETASYTTSSSFVLSPQGVLERSDYRYFFGGNGQVFIGMGFNNNYEIDLGVRAPVFSASGVFLDPTGVVNAASFAPVTNPIAPGELISLFGSNFAAQTTVAATLPFPNTLSGVRVSINGTPAPIYFVSPGQISVVVPYSLKVGTRATIQVTNDGVASNLVEMETANTSPGIFTLPPGGMGTGAILRQDFSVVSANNPARKGETIQIFLTGLGTVAPGVQAGAAGPANPLSTADAFVSVIVGGRVAKLTYAGLAPGLAGLYQVNAIIPATVTSGERAVEIDTTDAYHLQVTVPVQ